MEKETTVDLPEKFMEKAPGCAKPVQPATEAENSDNTAVSSAPAVTKPALQKVPFPYRLEKTKEEK